MPEVLTYYRDPDLADYLHRLGSVLDCLGDREEIVYRVRALQLRAEALSRELSELRTEVAAGERACRTCRWLVVSCAYGQPWARRGIGCSSWEE